MVVVGNVIRVSVYRDVFGKHAPRGEGRNVIFIFCLTTNFSCAPKFQNINKNKNKVVKKSFTAPLVIWHPGTRPPWPLKIRPYLLLVAVEGRKSIIIIDTGVVNENENTIACPKSFARDNMWWEYLGNFFLPPLSPYENFIFFA